MNKTTRVETSQQYDDYDLRLMSEAEGEGMYDRSCEVHASRVTLREIRTNIEGTP